MEITYIKSLLLKDVESIVKLLEYYKFDNIKLTTSEIRCGHNSDSNSTSVRIKLVEGIPSTDFSRSVSGDIFTLIMDVRNQKFYDVLQVTKDILSLDVINIVKKLPIFGGVYSHIKRGKDYNQLDLKTYSEEILMQYENGLNTRFLKDGISLKTQKKFKVGYDYDTQRITVPWTTYDGRIIGIMGRYNGNDQVDCKWFSIISFSKCNTLYGFSENYHSLLHNDTIFIGESEKFVMQLDSMGYNNCVSLGGNAINESQIKQIISTCPSNIIFCYDEGLNFKTLYTQCMKCYSICMKFGIRVGYVLDKEGNLLKPGSKNSPSDLGKQVFDELIRQNVIYL